MSYPGGKGSAYQTIINLIPPHDVYIEAFAGGAAVARMKRPAKENILIDLDQEVVNALIEDLVESGDTRWDIIQGDALAVLREVRLFGNEFVYLDPPYLLSTRRQHRQMYRYELTDAQHVELLDIAKRLPCCVMISGYWSEMYAKALEGWHAETFQAVTRGGSVATEYLWMNYPPPMELHDYRYLGDNFRERERIKRKKARWVRRLREMPRLERLAMAAAIAECVGAAASPGVARGYHLAVGDEVIAAGDEVTR